VSSTGRVATIGRATVDDGADEGATVGDGADESATAGLSADTGLSGCGIIDIAINVRANPVGSAIQPAHPAAGMMRRRICWSRDLGPESDGGGGASLDPPCSVCMAHNPLSVATIPRAVRRPLDGLSAAPVSRLPRLVVARCIGERNHHRFEVRGRPKVQFVAEWHMTLASARRPDLRSEKMTVSSCPGSLPSIAGERTAVSLSRDRVHFSCRHAGRRPERNLRGPANRIDRERLYSLFLLITYKA
jgi:hypothetical protein